ncbi:ArnT family glycosyltransferase [Candidatus Omnitrophota bacterium]
MVLSILLQIFFIVNYNANPIESDAIHYNLLAKNLLHNKIFSLDGKMVSLQRAPGYPFFIFLIYSLFGERILAVQVIQVLLTVLICLLVYKIGRIVFDENVGILAALITAVHPVFIFQSFPLLSETLMAFLITLSIYLAIISIQTHKIKYFILLGMLLGVSALTRPIVLLLPFFSIFILIFFYNWRKILRFATFFLMSFVLVVGIWIYRNYKHTDYFIPVQFMGGRSLWSGTYIPGMGFDEHPLTIKERGELSDRLYTKIRKEYKKTIEEKSSKFDIQLFLVTREMRGEAIKNIFKDPIGLIGILPYKFGRLYIGSYCYLYGVKESFNELLNSEEIIENVKIKLFVKSCILFVSILTIILSLIGIFTSITRIPYILPIFILLLYYNSVFVFFETMTRYSIPILSVIIILAAKGIYSLRDLYLAKAKQK